MAAASESVMRALYAEHGSALLGYAMRLSSGDRQRAEDLVQETLVRAWRHVDTLASERGSVRPWLFTVIRNLSIDAHRARQARPDEVGDEALSLLAVDDDADRMLEAWQVADALARLTPEHRSVLVEVYYRGRSVAQAAEALGIPAGTVKSRTYYALRALRLVFQEKGLAP